ncbi:MAG: NO-inducible flavohemoprotein [Sinobacterium sp.]|nr:NO-inducible flavohemoprotein [Sinobacterium sp.]
MLSQSTIDTVKSTVPLLEGVGPDITKAFYARMFEHNPELYNIFNKANQRKGTQANALFNAVIGYAKNIDNLGALGPVVSLIAHKHASLSVKPEQYDIIGGHLLATIQKTFDLPDNHEVLTAWGEAYGVLADIFIGAEEGIYASNENQDNGWRDFKDFTITNINEESPLVKSFTLKPADGKGVVPFQAGQYLGVRVKPDADDYYQIRQYSLSGFGAGDTYRISTRREEQGAVTQYMHGLSVGDTVEVQAPAGVFTLADGDEHVFISGGVGITPLLSMVKQLEAERPNAKVTFVQCVQSKEHELFAQELKDSSLNISYKLCLAEGSEGDYQGLVNADILSDCANSPTANYYTCGPLAFMKAAYKGLKSNNIAADKIHYEVFGPDASLEES